MKKLFSFLLLNFVVYVLQAQIQDPVKFKTELKSLSDTEAEIVFTATIDKGDRKSTRLNSSHTRPSRMPSSA